MALDLRNIQRWGIYLNQRRIQKYDFWEQMMKLLGPRSCNFLRQVASRIAIAAGVACLLSIIPQAARADSTQTYNVTATTASGQTITGNVTIDFTTGLVTTGAGGIDADGTMFSCPQSAKCHLGPAFPDVTTLRLYDGSSYLQLVWDKIGSGGPAPAAIALNSARSFCYFCGNDKGLDHFRRAKLTPITMPEPAEGLLLLAGLGALGLLFARQRKMTANV